MKLIDVQRTFNTEEKCLAYIERMRWPNGHVACVECGSTKISRITRETKGKNIRAQLYQCLEKNCAHQFSATAGTIFHDSHLPLQKWFMAIALICEAKKSISALQMQRHLGIGSYRTAWHLCHRIRAAMAENDLVLDAPAVETDETYVGAKSHRRHSRRPRPRKSVVLGMVERGGGRLKLVPVDDTKSRILKPLLEKHISERVGTIYTDEHPIYIFALKSKFAGKHETIVHKRTYGIGDIHTNTIENAFSLFKRGLNGTFHKVSKKHLRRYCDEFSYRFNRRKEQDEMFDQTAKRLVGGKKLTYKSLTAE
jgi:ISXO2-like transposase domain/Transposase zinc-ribbon domain